MVIVLRSIKPWRIGGVKIGNNNQAITFRKHSQIVRHKNDNRQFSDSPQKFGDSVSHKSVQCASYKTKFSLYKISFIFPMASVRFNDPTTILQRK